MEKPMQKRALWHENSAIRVITLDSCAEVSKSKPSLSGEPGT